MASERGPKALYGWKPVVYNAHLARDSISQKSLFMTKSVSKEVIIQANSYANVSIDLPVVDGYHLVGTCGFRLTDSNLRLIDYYIDFENGANKIKAVIKNEYAGVNKKTVYFHLLYIRSSFGS